MDGDFIPTVVESAEKNIYNFQFLLKPKNVQYGLRSCNNS